MRIFIIIAAAIALLTLTLSTNRVSAAGPQKPAKVNIELALKQQQGEYHPPYVAAWIENSKKKPVRTLLLWRKEPKWLKDIRRWWRRVGRKSPALVDAITSATRSAGSYSLSFNTTDDTQQPLPNGDYTLYIEVVREKGGRALLKQVFNLGAGKQEFTLPATEETDPITFTVINPTD